MPEEHEDQPSMDVPVVDMPAVEAEQPETDQDETETDAQPDQPPFSWQASEYVHHHKGAGWYAGLALLLAILLAAAIVFHLYLSIAVFVAMGLAIAVYAHKPPRLLQYSLDGSGIDISGKDYPYENFRSFSVITDESWHTIDLEPTQRFMPRLSILFSDEDFDAIIEHLSQYLPRTDREPDFIERVSRYVRF